jgi:hypothetical protein
VEEEKGADAAVAYSRQTEEYYETQPRNPVEIGRCFTVVPTFSTLRALLATCFTLVSCMANFSALKFVATCSSETWADFQRTVRHYIPKDITLHNHRCENLKS